MSSQEPTSVGEKTTPTGGEASANIVPSGTSEPNDARQVPAGQAESHTTSDTLTEAAPSADAPSPLPLDATTLAPSTAQVPAPIAQPSDSAVRGPTDSDNSH